MRPKAEPMTAVVREQADDVAFIFLVRPPANALDRSSLDELARTVQEVGRDPAVRAVVFGSRLDGVFCAGGDLKYWQGVPAAGEVAAAGLGVFRRIERLAKPTIAAINGSVVGDGLALVLACDVRIGSSAATFSLPELAYGFIPGWGVIGQLQRKVSPSIAWQMLLTGEQVGAVRARQVGLLSAVVPPAGMLPTASALAARMAGLPASAYRAAKCVLSGGSEEACFAAVWGGPDWQAGIDAFVHKTSPQFRTMKGAAIDGDGRRVPTNAVARRPDCCG